MRIDYGELKLRIRLVTLLESIGWTSTEGRGEQLRGPCPFPACRSNLASTSKAKKRSFSVHSGKNVYQCFGCGRSGNVLDFWQVYQGKSLRE
jgi:DNA primase